MGAFAAAVTKFAEEARERSLLVFKKSIQDVVEEMQQLTPAQTGFLRASLAASTEGVPAVKAGVHPEPGSTYSYDASDVSAIIAGLTLTDRIFVAFTAAYAPYVEFGSHGHQGRGMMRLAAQRWPSIVERNAQRLKNISAPTEPSP